MEGSVQPPAVALPDFFSDSDTESELSPECPIKEEMIEEVMRELYKEIAWPPACKGEAAESEAPAAETAAEQPYQEGGKSESCGASVSETASTVMAGLKYAGGKMWGVMDGCDGTGDDDEWLERVMEWGPEEMEVVDVGS